MTNHPFDLAGVLAPMPASIFCQDYLGKSYLHSPGPRERFSALLPWADLNQILRHHRLDVPRLRLVREGKPVPSESYLTYQVARRRPYGRTPRLQPQDVMRELREGATLILDSVDELHDPISALAENLEYGLRSRIQVNMYAGWRRSRGFDLHFDDHDVFILQISGRKHWKVYPKTKEAPEHPLWEGLLEDGDLLYIPRGWWHVAIPLDEPTLHLTVGLHHRTGADLLGWIHERMAKSDLVKQDVPRFAHADDKVAYLDRLRETWLDCCNTGIVDEYLADVDAHAEPRPVYALPAGGSPALLPDDNSGWSVSWLPPRPVDLGAPRGDRVIEFRCLGKRWRFAEAARPMLRVLQECRVVGMEELSNASGLADPAVVRAFVRELFQNGLCTILPGKRG